MSVEASDAVWKRSKASGTTLLVLLAIADHVNHNGEAWPSIRRLAKKCRTTERTVLRNIAQLVSDGELQKTTSQGRLTRYRITLTNDTGVTTDENVTTDTGVTKPLTPVSPTPDASVTQTVKNRNEPSNPPIVPPMENDDGTDGNETDSLDAGPGEGKPAEPDKPKAKTGSPGVKRRIAEDRQPDHAAIAYAKQHGVDVRREWPNFVDYHIRRDTTATERGFAAAWRTWCRNAVKFAERDKRMAGPARTGKPSDWIEAFAMAEREANGGHAATGAAGLWGDDEGDVDSTGQILPFGRIGRA